MLFYIIDAMKIVEDNKRRFYLKFRCGNDISWGKFDFRELYSQNEEKWVITVFSSELLSRENEQKGSKISDLVHNSA